MGLHVGTHKDDGTVDTVQAVEDSATEDCGNAYFRNKEMIVNATGSATKASALMSYRWYWNMSSMSRGKDLFQWILI